MPLLDIVDFVPKRCRHPTDEGATCSSTSVPSGRQSTADPGKCRLGVVLGD